MPIRYVFIYMHTLLKDIVLWSFPFAYIYYMYVCIHVMPMSPLPCTVIAPPVSAEKQSTKCSASDSTCSKPPSLTVLRCRSLRHKTAQVHASQRLWQCPP